MSMKGMLNFKKCKLLALIPFIALGILMLFAIFSVYQEGMEDGVYDLNENRDMLNKDSDIKDNMDDYVLKTSIVPPVCPACPDVKLASRDKPCPPCPACERCPESSFECKKIPKYSNNNSYIPVPVLNDFSGFGL